MLIRIFSIISLLSISTMLCSQSISCKVENCLINDNYILLEFNISNNSNKNILIYYNAVYQNDSNFINPSLVVDSALNEVIIDLMQYNSKFIDGENVIVGKKLLPNENAKFRIKIDTHYNTFNKKLKFKFLYSNSWLRNRNKTFVVNTNKRKLRKLRESMEIIIDVK